MLAVLGGHAHLRSMRMLHVHGALTLLCVAAAADLEPIKQVAFEARALGLDAEYEVLPAALVRNDAVVEAAGGHNGGDDDGDDASDSGVLAAATAAAPDSDPLEDKSGGGILVCTLLCGTPTVPTPLYAGLTRVLSEAECNIAQLQRLSDESDAQAVVEFVFSSTFSTDSPAFHELSRKLRAVAAAHQADIALQQQSLLRARKRMVVFDLTGTLLATDVWRALARVMGVEVRPVCRFMCWPDRAHLTENNGRSVVVQRL